MMTTQRYYKTIQSTLDTLKVWYRYRMDYGVTIHWRIQWGGVAGVATPLNFQKNIGLPRGRCDRFTRVAVVVDLDYLLLHQTMRFCIVLDQVSGAQVVDQVAGAQVVVNQVAGTQVLDQVAGVHVVVDQLSDRSSCGGSSDRNSGGRSSGSSSGGGSNGRSSCIHI